MSNRVPIPFKIKQIVLKRDRFKCQKCGFIGTTEDLEIHHVHLKVDGGEHEPSNLVTLCTICHYYAPEESNSFSEYIKEKIDGTILDTFRKSQKSIARRTKKGMTQKASGGKMVSRAPFGYKLENKQMIQAENSYLVQEVFQDFLNQNISLTKLAKKYGFSVNGIKKILRNQTYLGKIKFDGQTYQGSHPSLISSTLFNHVQNKLEKLGIK